MKKSPPIKELSLLIIILCAIWAPVIMSKYDYLTAIISTFSIVVGGYFGDKLFNNK